MQYSTTAGAQGICPAGWHLPPTEAEFQTLITTVNGDGNALKAVGQGSGSGEGTNTSGFSVLLSGYRNIGGFFNELDFATGFWCSTEYNETTAYPLWLINDESISSFGYNSKD